MTNRNKLFIVSLNCFGHPEFALSKPPGKSSWWHLKPHLPLSVHLLLSHGNTGQQGNQPAHNSGHRGHRGKESRYELRAIQGKESDGESSGVNFRSHERAKLLHAGHGAKVGATGIVRIFPICESFKCSQLMTQSSGEK